MHYTAHLTVVHDGTVPDDGDWPNYREAKPLL